MHLQDVTLLLTETFMLNFVMRKLRNAMSFVRQNAVLR